jgi:hypothetical protein
MPTPHTNPANMGCAKRKGTLPRIQEPFTAKFCTLDGQISSRRLLLIFTLHDKYEMRD